MDVRNFAPAVVLASLIVDGVVAYVLIEVVPALPWRIRRLPKRNQVSSGHGPRKLHLAEFIEGREVWGYTETENEGSGSLSAPPQKLTPANLRLRNH